MSSRFTKQWGSRPSIRHIGGRAYHFQESVDTKSFSENVAKYYRDQGRLVRVFKRFVPEHALKGSLKFRGKVTIIPSYTTHDVYATVVLKKRRK